MRERLIINALCLLIAIAAIGVAIWAVLSGQVIREGIDGLFLIVICLLIALAFSVSPMRELRRNKRRP
jgi:hypothetical protein